MISNSNVEPGILNSVVGLMSVRKQSVTSGERVCILEFEMKIDSKYCCDNSSDNIYKPHQSIQVLFIRGIIGK